MVEERIESTVSLLTGLMNCNSLFTHVLDEIQLKFLLVSSIWVRLSGFITLQSNDHLHSPSGCTFHRTLGIKVRLRKRLHLRYQHLQKRSRLEMEKKNKTTLLSNSLPTCGIRMSHPLPVSSKNMGRATSSQLQYSTYIPLRFSRH